MSNIKKLCKNVSSDMRPLAETLADAVLAMQKKIKEQIPVYREMPLAQQVKVGTGEKMLRQNPAVQEFRATVRDYAAALRSLQEIVDENQSTTSVAGLEDLRSRFNIS